jgi:hypothetical protein
MHRRGCRIDLARADAMLNVLRKVQRNWPGTSRAGVFRCRRQWCLADPAEAEAERQALMVAQVEGQLAADAAVRARRSAQDRAQVRRSWATTRWQIFSRRDALTCGLGWPHRGELVTVSTWRHDAAGAKVPVTGKGMYLNSFDIFNVSHEVWLFARSASPREGAVLVRWLPEREDATGRLGPADPAGDIGLRLFHEPERRLPAPLMRWPAPADVGIAVPAPHMPAADPGLFSAAQVPRPAAGWPAAASRRPRERHREPARPAEEEGTLF